MRQAPGWLSREATLSAIAMLSARQLIAAAELRCRFSLLSASDAASFASWLKLLSRFQERQLADGSEFSATKTGRHAITAA
jgi:hypothetical protein